MKINKKKLGFTLVELLVVIAILAVLATVAIIGYSSFINEAHKSNDNSVVTELNHYLKAANPLDEEIPTATDAAEKLEGCGLNIAELQPSAKDAYYGYNYKSSEFVYIEDIVHWQENGQTVSDERKLSTFVFAKKEGQVTAAYTNGYSVYLQKDYNVVGGNYANASFKAVNGLDVGEATVSAVDYTSSSGNTVVIRTNGGTLTVNAENDTVKHYGEGLVLNIENVDTQNCYREFGSFANAQIKRGKVVIENSEASIDNLLLVAKSDKSGFEDIIVETKTGAELPTFDRTDVNIAATGTLVLNVVTPSTDEYVYLTKAGVVEQIVVTETVQADVSGEMANVASKSASTQAVAEQVANVGTKDASGNYVDSNNEIVIYADGTVAEGKDGSSIATEAKADDTAVQTGLTKFAGGAGTEKSPYLIANATHFQNVVSGTSSAKKYYQLINDIDLSATGTDKGSGIVSLFEYAVLNGANHQIAVNNSEYFLFHTVLYSTISDVNVVELKHPMVRYANFSTFNDVDTIGKINCADQNLGIYVIYAKQSLAGNEVTRAELTYIDCDCGVDFSSEGGKYNGVFTGYAYPNKTTELTYTNCTYNATFVSGKAAMFLGNNNANSDYVTINVNNCENCGIIRSTDTNYNWSSYVATGISSNASDQSFTNNTVILNGVKLTADNICEPMGYGFVQGPNDANLKLVQNSDGTFTVTASENTNVSYYVVSVGLYSYLNVGGTLVQQVSEKIETSAFNNKTFTTALKNLSFVDKAWVEANSSATAETVGEGEYAYTVYTLNGIQYYYLPNVEKANVGGQPKAPQMIVVSCYDANGDLIASAVLSK